MKIKILVPKFCVVSYHTVVCFFMCTHYWQPANNVYPIYCSKAVHASLVPDPQEWGSQEPHVRMSRLTSDSDLGVDFIQFLKINDFSGDWGGINKDTIVVVLLQSWQCVCVCIRLQSQK